MEELKLNVPVIHRNDIEFTNKLLGEGGQGTVETGRWISAQMPVAIKSCYRSTVKDKGMMREIVLLDKVRHPNIVSLLGVCCTGYSYHIVLELFDGSSLGDVLFGNLLRLYKPDKISILQKVSMALMFLHETLNPFILHRDIKPHNILIQKKGRDFQVKLCDFGMAKSECVITSLRVTNAGTIKGTKWYLAPEILINHSEATVDSDIWALGVTVVEMFSVRHFWDRLDLAYVIQRMEKNDIPPVVGVPKVLEPMIKRCLSKKPSIRPKISAIIGKMQQYGLWKE